MRIKYSDILKSEMEKWTQEDITKFRRQRWKQIETGLEPLLGLKIWTWFNLDKKPLLLDGRTHQWTHSPQFCDWDMLMAHPLANCTPGFVIKEDSRLHIIAWDFDQCLFGKRDPAVNKVPDKELQYSDGVFKQFGPTEQMLNEIHGYLELSLSWSGFHVIQVTDTFDETLFKGRKKFKKQYGLGEILWAGRAGKLCVCTGMTIPHRFETTCKYVEDEDLHYLIDKYIDLTVKDPEVKTPVRKTYTQNPGAGTQRDIITRMQKLGFPLKPNQNHSTTTWQTECPNRSQHSNDDPLSATISVWPDGWKISCNHNHCNDSARLKSMLWDEIHRREIERAESLSRSDKK